MLKGQYITWNSDNTGRTHVGEYNVLSY